MRIRPFIICKECGRKRMHHAKRLCSPCYLRQYKPRVITCKECGLEKPHQAKGLCHTCYNRQWYANNQERGIAIARAWQKRNPEKVRRWSREGRRITICKKCNQQKPHIALGLCKSCYEKEWRTENPEKVKARYYRSLATQLANNRRRRAREANVPSTLTAEQIAQLYAIGRCFYCSKPTHLTLDHFVPIVRGGGTTKANIILACRRCNSSKHTKLPQEILAQLDFMDSVSILK